jgi:hypothetical protein
VWHIAAPLEGAAMSDDHPIKIAPTEGRIIVRWRGREQIV